MKTEHLEIAVEGKLAGHVDITRTSNGFEINGDVLQNGTWMFTREEIGELIKKRLSKKYEGKNIEIRYQD